jgi:hypothetical protein
VYNTVLIIHDLYLDTCFVQHDRVSIIHVLVCGDLMLRCVCTWDNGVTLPNAHSHSDAMILAVRTSLSDSVTHPSQTQNNSN